MFLFVFSISLAVSKESSFGMKLNYDAKGSMWFSADDDDGQDSFGHAFDYITEFIPNHHVHTDFRWNGSSVLQVIYETPILENNYDQEGNLETSDKPSSIRKIETIVDLIFLASGTNNVTNFFGNMRLGYLRYDFFGKAIVQEDSVYINGTSRTPLKPGEEIRFKTRYEEISATWRWGAKRHIGIYRGVTNKPHEAGPADAFSFDLLASGTSSDVIRVIQTKITGIGVKFINYQANDTVKSDINVGIVQFRGIDNDFESDGFELLIRSKWQPLFSIYGNAKPMSKFHVALAPFIGGQFSVQGGGESSGHEKVEKSEGEFTMDIILEAGLGFVMQF